MSEPGSRRGRVHDAEGAREAILNAAEEVFAEHGFDGARIDAIAAAADYNKSLIFHYFDDKLGLYAAVLRRADREMNELAPLFLPLLEDETNAHTFKTFLKTATGAFFDYLLEHPRFMRMLLWEMAEGWQTYAKIISQRDREDVEQFRPFLYKVQSAGLIRSGFDPIMQLTMVIQICQSHLAFIPLYRMLLPGEDVSSAVALADAREYIIDFVVRGMMVDLHETRHEK